MTKRYGDRALLSLLTDPGNAPGAVEFVSDFARDDSYEG